MKLKDFLIICIVSILAVLLITCCTPVNPNVKAQETDSVDALILSTLFNNMAAEHQALCHQAYNIAQYHIDQIDNPEGKAIVLDIDETVLNNSPFQAKMVDCNRNFSSDAWKEWCDLARAVAIPGVVDFLNNADQKGFKIFYLSNRYYNTLAPTMHNMDSLGFPQVEKKSYLLKTTTSNKQIRRDSITNVYGYDIVMLCGDQLGDFYEDVTDFNKRQQMMKDSAEKFGERFIVLPNAMYGSWIKAIGYKQKDPESIKKNIHKAAANFDLSCDEIPW